MADGYMADLPTRYILHITYSLHYIRLVTFGGGWDGILKHASSLLLFCGTHVLGDFSYPRRV